MAKPGTIEFECPACHQVSRVPAEYAGRQGKCPKCAVGIEVPGPAGETQAKAPAGKTAKAPAAKAPAAKAPTAKAPAAKVRPEAEDESEADDDRKDCPYCGEQIAKAATKCKHCGERLDDEPAEAGAAPPLVLRIWGVITIGLAALWSIDLVRGILVSGLRVGAGFILTAAMVRIGLALFRGQRQGVVGMGILGGFLVLLAGFFLSIGMKIGAGAVMGFVAILCAPPVIVGALRWSDLPTTTPTPTTPTTPTT